MKLKSFPFSKLVHHVNEKQKIDREKKKKSPEYI
jgi:hypothetical protein